MHWPQCLAPLPLQWGGGWEINSRVLATLRLVLMFSSSEVISLLHNPVSNHSENCGLSLTAFLFTFTRPVGHPDQDSESWSEALLPLGRCPGVLGWTALGRQPGLGDDPTHCGPSPL